MLTTDPTDPRLNQPGPDGQNDVYLVLSDEERAKGFVRPFRTAYLHEACGCVTTMGDALAETYARQPDFYSHTMCMTCGAHFPVAEFVWYGTTEKVGS